MRSVNLGILGILGIWATMSMMPLAELLPLNAYQLLAIRGAPGLILLVLAAAGKVQLSMPDRYLLVSIGLFGLAALALFEAIKSWGANLSAVLLDMAVLVNFIYAIAGRQKVGIASYLLFCAAIAGSFLALRGWDLRTLNWWGLLCSLVALVANGLFIEYATKAKQGFCTKVFWMSAGLVAVGMACSFGVPWPLSNTQIAVAAWLGVATGLLNFLCAFLAFGNLPAVATGVLVLGVTPSILIGSWVILGRTLGYDQLLGVAIILVSVGFLGYLLKQKTNREASL